MSEIKIKKIEKEDINLNINNIISHKSGNNVELSTCEKKDKNNIECIHQYSKDNYYLIGLIYHLGDTIQGGHYITKIKRNGQWYEINDSHVNEIDNYKYNNDETEDYPYLLFYKKNDKENKTSKTNRPKGITNCNNTCFANAVLQNLLNIDEIQKLLSTEKTSLNELNNNYDFISFIKKELDTDIMTKINKNNKIKDKITEEIKDKDNISLQQDIINILRDIFDLYFNTDTDNIPKDKITIPLENLFNKINVVLNKKEFVIGTQSDAQEFLNKILEKLFIINHIFNIREIFITTCIRNNNSIFNKINSDNIFQSRFIESKYFKENEIDIFKNIEDPPENYKPIEDCKNDTIKRIIEYVPLSNYIIIHNKLFNNVYNTGGKSKRKYGKSRRRKTSKSKRKHNKKKYNKKKYNKTRKVKRSKYKKLKQRKNKRSIKK